MAADVPQVRVIEATAQRVLATIRHVLVIATDSNSRAAGVLIVVKGTATAACKAIDSLHVHRRRCMVNNGRHRTVLLL